jgi:hypothetical protein
MTRCEECPFALICLMGGAYPHFLMVRVCPRCGLNRFVKGDRKANDARADCDVAERPYIHCPQRQLTRRQKGTWKAQVKRFLKNEQRLSDVRDTFITVPDPEQPEAPYGMLVILCDDCFAAALPSAMQPRAMGSASPWEFYGWCPD